MTGNILAQAPKNILLPRFDTLGDLVLLEGLVEALMQALPQSRITLLVRRAYADLCSLFPEGLEWMVTDVDPHASDPDAAQGESLLKQVGAEEYDLLLITAYSRTWADNLLAAKLGHAQRVALGIWAEMLPYHRDLFGRLGLNPGNPYTDLINVPQTLHEVKKYNCLWRALGGNSPLPEPRLSVKEPQSTGACKILESLGLEVKRYCLCFPAGTQRVSIKIWPPERFADIIADLENKHGCLSLVAGHRSERSQIAEVVGLAQGKGADPKVWLGREGEIPLLAGLTAQASFYLGNDTGPMHVAAAVGTAVVAIFGGGTWPRFVPRGKNSLAIAGEMPCFGCGWDCMFGDAPCMRLVTVDDVKRAIESICLDPAAVEKNVTRVRSASMKLSEEARYYVEKAAKHRRRIEREVAEIEKDRSAQLDLIDRLRRRLKEVESDRSARLELIESMNSQIAEIEADRASRLEMINELSSQIAEIEKDRAARLQLIEKLASEIGIIEEDRAARLRVIEELDGALRAARSELEQVRQKLHQIRSNLLVKALMKLHLVRSSPHGQAKKVG